MVCSFCPDSGSAAEKSFNRADVFKRHLTAVHGVLQTPPNSRKKTPSNLGGGGTKKLVGYAPDATGKCSTCPHTFSNAQDFYEHLDDCVLRRIGDQEDPAEAINAKRLAEVENDRDVHNTLEAHGLPTTTDVGDGDDDPDEELRDDDLKTSYYVKPTSPTTNHTKGDPPNDVQRSTGLASSGGGVSLSRKRRRDYPSSWGFDKGQISIKKRLMAVFSGARRLTKDDVVLSAEKEVRVRLPDGASYLTDLDGQSLKRAEGSVGASTAEHDSDEPTAEQLKSRVESVTGQWSSNDSSLPSGDTAVSTILLYLSNFPLCFGLTDINFP